MDDGGMDVLTEGDIYTVVDEAENNDGDPTYRLDGFPGKMFRQARFKVVEETKPPTKAAGVDLSDWKVWRDFGKPAGTCACGIQASMCDYHR